MNRTREVAQPEPYSSPLPEVVYIVTLVDGPIMRIKATQANYFEVNGGGGGAMYRFSRNEQAVAYFSYRDVRNICVETEPLEELPARRMR